MYKNKEDWLVIKLNLDSLKLHPFLNNVCNSLLIEYNKILKMLIKFIQDMFANNN